MAPVIIVKHFQIVNGESYGELVRGRGFLWEALAFEIADDSLDDGIVSTVAGPTHATRHLMLSQ